MENYSDHKNTSRDLIYTIKNRCRVCYTCVRECPAKAIKIINGQAEVVNERCIACGNCIKVCSQDAKGFLDTREHFDNLLNRPGKNIAIVAPSFPAEFSEISNYKDFVSMIRSLGFDVVSEVAFGADLVARKYNELIQQNGNKRYISSDCPAIVKYVERYHPGLVENLAPITSPMIAMARVMKKKYGEQTNVVLSDLVLLKKQKVTRWMRCLLLPS